MSRAPESPPTQSRAYDMTFSLVFTCRGSHTVTDVDSRPARSMKNHNQSLSLSLAFVSCVWYTCVVIGYRTAISFVFIANAVHVEIAIAPHPASMVPTAPWGSSTTDQT